jgi:hypothetical protein
MFSRYTSKFVQGTWNSVWADEQTGQPITPNYNDALYPIEVSNKGAIQERWALVFTDISTFRIIGEVSGQMELAQQQMIVHRLIQLQSSLTLLCKKRVGAQVG